MAQKLDKKERKRIRKSRKTRKIHNDSKIKPFRLSRKNRGGMSRHRKNIFEHQKKIRQMAAKLGTL